MKDIFDATILCKQCKTEMQPTEVARNGLMLRAVVCRDCGQRIVHPGDLQRFQHYNDLKRKTYNVKLRMVGNSHAISIPKEVVDFIQEINQEMHKEMSEMVRLCFEDFGRLSLCFIDNKEGRKTRW